MFCKTGVIRNFAIFTRNSLQGQPAILFQPSPKGDFNTDDSCENCKIFTKSFFYRALPVAAFFSLIK